MLYYKLDPVVLTFPGHTAGFFLARLASAKARGEVEAGPLCGKILLMLFYVYILKSVNYPKTYVGHTNDLERRLKEHNSGFSLFTKRFCPWELLHKEVFDSESDSIKRERYFKSAAGRRWMKKNLFS